MSSTSDLVKSINLSLSNEVYENCANIARWATEMVQQFQDSIRQLVETYKQNIDLEIKTLRQTFARFSRLYSVIEIMGEAQFVCWEYLSTSYIDSIINSDNVNKTLREHFELDRYRKVNNTIEKTLSAPVMCKHQRLYLQSVHAFQNGDRDLAVIGFTSVLDGLLSDVTNDPTHQLKKRIDSIVNKIQEDVILSHDEYALVTLVMTFEKTLHSFSKSIPFSEKEPKELNRHWIAHGRSSRKKTKLDCVKMINMIFGLLLLGELANHAENDEN